MVVRETGPTGDPWTGANLALVTAAWLSSRLSLLQLIDCIGYEFRKNDCLMVRCRITAAFPLGKGFIMVITDNIVLRRLAAREWRRPEHGLARAQLCRLWSEMGPEQSAPD